MSDDRKLIRISVRNLVEFILKSGDLDNRHGKKEVDAMQEGVRLHKKLQKQMKGDYIPEVQLKFTLTAEAEGEAFDLEIEGRADGIYTDEITYIDEIKCVYEDVSRLEEPYEIHLAQAKCYALMYALNDNTTEDENRKDTDRAIGIRMTYCNIETELVKYIINKYTIAELRVWFDRLIDEYAKWAVWQIKWNRERNESIKAVPFPFDYRNGQKELVASVYRTIVRDKLLFIEAPTGVGKTISTVFPTIKAIGEEKAEKIFYLTAKTITRTVAEETFDHLVDAGVKMIVVTITAKEKLCLLEKPDCNPVACERAGGHYDRVNDAVYDMLTNENRIDRDMIMAYAKKHCVCPFEMSLDVTLWADAVICDYNYVFDPNVYLRRFFADEKKHDYVFLIDEAHNLVDRAREMYSAVLVKEDFLKTKRNIIGSEDGQARRKFDKNLDTLIKRLDTCNKLLLEMKRDCDEFEIWEEDNDFALQLIRLMTAFDEFFSDERTIENRDEVLLFYLDVKHYLHMHEIMDENYMIYSDYDEKGSFHIKLMCMDASNNLRQCLAKGKSAIFFSATLLPINYYKEQLGGNSEDYAIYAPSPFNTKNRLLMIGRDVSTKYNKRGHDEFMKIYEYIKVFTSAKTGNYMVFFPSYQMMNDIADIAIDEGMEGIVLQETNMTEADKERFLDEFVAEPEKSRIGFCVMGGIFGEGIDLKSNRLIGAVVVGTGLPMVCNEREMFRGFYDRRSGNGFEYAYLYAGMNKVQQSAGRVIRTDEDRGCILLLDERFTNQQYKRLFPREWEEHEVVNLDKMKLLLENFWDSINRHNMI